MYWCLLVATCTPRLRTAGPTKMDYLLLKGKRVCSIKVKERAGRVRLTPGASVSFPRKINFWCSKRPLPQYSYEIHLRGIGAAPLNIRAVGAPGGDNYDVFAEIAPATGPAEGGVRPNRRIPGRATGRLALVLRWPGGNACESGCHSLDQAIRVFSRQLRRVAPEERHAVTAHLQASVRGSHGGERRKTLASWTCTQPVPEFFRLARVAWRRMPKEQADLENGISR